LPEKLRLAIQILSQLLRSESDARARMQMECALKERSFLFLLSERFVLRM